MWYLKFLYFNLVPPIGLSVHGFNKETPQIKCWTLLFWSYFKSTLNTRLRFQRSLKENFNFRNKRLISWTQAGWLRNANQLLSYLQDKTENGNQTNWTWTHKLEFFSVVSLCVFPSPNLRDCVFLQLLKLRSNWLECGVTNSSRSCRKSAMLNISYCTWEKLCVCAVFAVQGALGVGGVGVLKRKWRELLAQMGTCKTWLHFHSFKK